VLIPWSEFWTTNYFAEAVPLVGRLIANNYLRGGVTGLGLVNVWIGVAEIGDMLADRRSPAS
jgi:hypothetical protein